MENKEIRKAKKVLEEISQDERERRLTELRQKYIMDQHAIYDAGYDEGIEDGIEQGIEKGIEKNQIEIVKRMYADNFDVSTISKITKLAEEEINKIIDEK